MSAEELKFAIVGCGNIGSRHATHIQAVGKLEAVCDIDSGKLVQFDGSPGIKKFQELDQMLAEMKGRVDVLSICSPNGLHKKHTILALQAGFHVLCEKPMALSSSDCGEMIQAAEAANRRLFVVKQNRYNPPIVALKKLLDEGALGPVYSAHLNCFWNRNDNYYETAWKGTNELDGGCLYTQFSHFIDLLYWMIGDFDQVQAITGNYNHKGVIEFEDSGVVIGVFDNGALGSVNFSVNSYSKNMEGSLTLFCEHGTVKVGGQYLNELEYHCTNEQSLEDVPIVHKANDYGEYQGSMSNHDKVYENVVDVLRNGGTIGTTGYEGLKTVEIIEKIYAASTNAQVGSRL